jgi:hypothetical protein
MKRTEVNIGSEVKLDDLVVCASCTGTFAPESESVHIRKRGQDEEKEYYCQRECPNCSCRRPTIIPVTWDAEDSAGAEVTDTYPGRA